MIEVRNLKIEDVCTFIGGSQPPKSVFSGFPIEGYVRLVQIRDFKNENFPTYIPLDSTSKFFEKKDVMIGRYGPPIFQILRGLEGAYNVALLKARPKKNIINDYLYYFLKQLDLFEYIDKLSPRTGGQTGVDLFSLNQYPIRLPDLLTQQKIASVLSALDDKIELNNRINAELEAMAKLLYKYWFVQFDFPYDFRQSKPADETSKTQDIKPYKSSGGKMVWNKDLNREIPEGWGSGFLNDLGKIIGGSTPSRNNPEFFTEDGIPWITPKDLSNNVGNKYIFKGESDVTQKGKDNASLNILPKGTILMSSRAPIGYVAISVCDVTTNQGFKSFIPEDPFTTEFVFYKLNEMMPVIENNASGSTFKEVSAGTLKTIKIVLPPEKVIQSFTSKVSPVFKKQENLQIQNQELSSLRDWLLPMLMNGQVTVEDAEERVNEELGMVAEGERGRYEKK
jgi:type I restriction enzyme S subunit